MRSQPGTQEVGVSHSCTAISRSVTGLASLTYRIRLIGFRVGVADLAGMEVRRAVALRGPGGLALISAVGRCGLAFERCADLPGASPWRGS